MVEYVVTSVMAIFCLVNFLNARGVLNLVEYKDAKQRTKAKKLFFWLTIVSLLLLLSEYLGP
jgi:hypothetical protein